MIVSFFFVSMTDKHAMGTKLATAVLGCTIKFLFTVLHSIRGQSLFYDEAVSTQVTV